MRPAVPETTLAVTACAILLLATEPAHALRCGTRLVKEGMLEAQVIELCGEPVSRQDLGYVLCPYLVKRPAGRPGHHSTTYVYGGYHEELRVTELLFNFGPRKLMRILRFEGNRLTSIQTAGYGYLEKPD